MSSERYSHISSTLIKQIAQMASDEKQDRLSEFIPEHIIEPLIRRLRSQ
jgi:pantetheine-phosphate adenylyltransferase